MGASEQTLTPVAVALHTRDREEDYRWYPESGPAFLATKLKGLHRDLIADQDAKPAATFVLFDQAERVGLLVANLKTERIDHYRTRIDDTLILEFAAKDRKLVYRLTAGLLGADSGEVLRRLLDYAESRFKPGSSVSTIEPLTIPVPDPAAGKVDIRKPYVALHSNEGNQRRVVDLLHRAAINPASVKQPFVLVSTGFVGRDKLQQHARVGKQFIGLSRSPDIPEGEDVSLENAPIKPLPMSIIIAAASVGLLVLSMSGWALLGRHSNSFTTGYVEKTPDSAKKTPDSAKKTPDSTKTLPGDHATDMRKKLARAGGLVGMAASSNGHGPLLILLPLHFSEEQDRGVTRK
jgi:hypothetical protein